MTRIDRVVVVGGGLAGAKTVEALREQGFEGAVTLLAAEAHLPYERPPLSKAYLAGRASLDDTVVHEAGWYLDHDVDLRTGVRVTSVDALAHRVRLADGAELGYDRLVLATGSAPRHLSLPGATEGAVHYLRTREDAQALRELFGPGRRLIVVGGGWVGLEVAAAATEAGTHVTVLEAADLPLLRVLGPRVARILADVHRARGVDLRLGVRIAGLVNEGGRATGVRLDDGLVLEGDAVLAGIGVLPEVGLARSAGLEVQDGVLVDSALRTSDPHVFAVGDMANHDHPVLGYRVRVEHWANALNQPAAAVATLLGRRTPYTRLPYFFSDQYDVGMEYLGHPGHQRTRVVIRGDVDAPAFVAFWVDGIGHVRAVLSVNVWDVVDEVRPLLAEGRPVAPERLADPSVALSAL
ncbi:FAD-dependent oxidoreductase [Phycicoccus sp.]|uniref:NAD(P)/FAD-dependent oxidoreductase n=1 Tax=Phycicoccus sp. TaxID=1902410 RepID=UPI002B5FDB93|nr:FAD-dependent oxidoreductase [Phycicoccus sp.]HMM97274.1 FAD-dependent oxidoreductase [Phycicoccus sp.]